MLNRNETELLIFDNFQIDWALPKHLKPPVDKTIAPSDDDLKAMMSPNPNPTGFVSGGSWVVPVNEQMSVDNSPSKESFWSKFFKKKKKAPKIIGYQLIKDFFNQLNTEAKELKNVSEIAQFYEKEILKANSFHQDAYMEILLQQKETIRLESYLIEMGFTKYVTEKQVIDFYQKVKDDKNIKLTWIKNYIRPIPNSILDLKVSIDEKKFFDNYVILHYDPKGTGSAMTEKEKERAKDPILFGVVRSSRKLYFIADWKDEYCDLTLDVMFEKLGEKVGEINNESVRTYMKDLSPNAHTFEEYIN